MVPGGGHSSGEPRGWRAVVWLATTLLALMLLVIAADQLLRPDAFPVRHIRISGQLSHVKPEVIQQAVLPHARGNFFTVNIDRLERVATTLPWIYKATVRREWPRTMHVRVQEQQPIARWGESGWLNRDGEIVQLPLVPGMERMALLTGPAGTSRDVAQRYRQWGSILATSGMRIKSLTLSERRAWQLQVRLPPRVSAVAVTTESTWDDGAILDIVIGKHDIDARVTRFARALAAAPGPQWLHAQRVDLRYPNGFSVQWMPGVEYPVQPASTTEPDQA